VTDAPNLLYYGDNLDAMRRHVPDASVDLVCLEHGEKAAAQVGAEERERG
jgi:hypothetical protein